MEEQVRGSRNCLTGPVTTENYCELRSNCSIFSPATPAAIENFVHRRVTNIFMVGDSLTFHSFLVFFFFTFFTFSGGCGSAVMDVVILSCMS